MLHVNKIAKFRLYLNLKIYLFMQKNTGKFVTIIKSSKYNSLFIT
jgi:hypothetical protein